MGNCFVSGQLKEELKHDKEINKYLRDEKRKIDDEIKLLLLGAGESGKSTIAKQMKILHKKGFTDQERLAFKAIIFNNIISSMKTLVVACRDLNIPIQNQDAAKKILEVDFGSSISPDVAATIKLLWKSDDGIKQAYERQSEFQLTDSAAYYFDAIDRISASNFVPDESDVLHSRAKTTGIIETDFLIENVKFKMVDVGGQRSERKKWMHCFQEVTAVLFCVALSEYDLKLQEDESTNRMHESLKLFKEICNSKWFMDTSMILFLNKKDLFEQKIKKVPLNRCFPDYTGGSTYDHACNFIKGKFTSVNENPKKHIYVHFTCATDTGNIQVVFNAVKDIVLHQVLDDSGLGF